MKYRYLLILNLAILIFVSMRPDSNFLNASRRITPTILERYGYTKSVALPPREYIIALEKLYDSKLEDIEIYYSSISDLTYLFAKYKEKGRAKTLVKIL